MAIENLFPNFFHENKLFYLFDLYCSIVEREAQDAHGARDAEAEGVGRGLRSRTQGLEEPTQAKKTGRNTSTLTESSLGKIPLLSFNRKFWSMALMKTCETSSFM